MIVGKLKDLYFYKGLNSNLDKAITYILENNLNTLKDGNNYIDGKNVFINKFNYICQDKNDCFFEGHRKYIDIHIVLKGSEMFGYNDISDLSEASKYDLENDFIKFEGPIKASIKASVGDFIITFPEDIHMPKMPLNNELVEKVVCKVLV
ncbi:YhcH/YjgK/YiaL family protein [Clostridium sp.]|uniref:YhcH/YjgK/YiaL family protein n=1 Tax=Clostridium sp. TaxID=1506 RepID=UPI00260E6419|nr:YhcH/YjgK/YiaL family protein [Clostridium sp.]